MSSNTQKAVKDKIEAFVQKGFMFTSFDVTRAVRVDLGSHIKVFHSGVKSMVNDMHDNGEMGTHVKEIISVGTSVAPWLYYNPSSDVNDYNPHWLDTDPNQDNMKASASVGYTPPTLDLDDEDDTPVSSVTAILPKANTATVIPTVRLSKNEHKTTKEVQ